MSADEQGGEQTRMSETRSDPEELRREIEETRSELGDTVEALSHKADVKAQAREKIDERKQAVSAKADELKQKVSQTTPDDVKSAASGAASSARERPEVPAIAGALLFGLLLGWLLGRR
jgi:ElaB/YqjD/DUF883 family membrane-anchored ribosome-binding protein